MSRHHSDFVGIHALGHIMYTYLLLVPMNQRVLNKPSKKDNIIGHKRSLTRRVLKSHRSKMSIIYMLSSKQGSLVAITKISLWKLMQLGAPCTVTHC